MFFGVALLHPGTYVFPFSLPNNSLVGTGVLLEPFALSLIALRVPKAKGQGPRQFLL